MNSSDVVVFFRCDASNKIGAGHFYRCLTLAKALKRSNVVCHFISHRLPSEYIAQLKHFGFTLSTFDCIEKDLKATLHAIDNNVPSHNTRTIIIADGYHLSPDWYEAVYSNVDTLVSIEDTVRKQAIYDLVLNQSASVGKNNYDHKPEHAYAMLGTQYVLLSSDFTPKEFSIDLQPEKRIVLSFGAMDMNCWLLPILEKLQERDYFHQFEINIIISSQSVSLSSIKNFTTHSSLKITLHVDTQEVAKIYRSASVAIGSCGISTWERASCGIASVVIAEADNQNDNFSLLAIKEAAACVDVSGHSVLQQIINETKNLLIDNCYRKRVTGNAKKLCDGKGAERVSSNILNSPYLREFDVRDAGLLFEWQSHPETRKYARNRETPDRKEHQRWVLNSLNSKTRHMYILLQGDNAVGMVRLDFGLHNKDTDAEVSILIAPKHYRKGLGKWALNLVKKKFPKATYFAYIKSENTASIKLFTSCGYITYRENWYVLGKPNENS